MIPTSSSASSQRKNSIENQGDRPILHSLPVVLTEQGACLVLSFGDQSKYDWLPGWLSGKESACTAGDTGLIPRSGRSPGEQNSNSLQYSCLENPTDRGV